MKQSFLRTESYKRGIVYSTAFNVVAKALAFLTSMVIAYYFGTQSSTDVYFYCFATVATITGFVTSLNSSVIVPESMRLAQQQDSRESMRFINFFLYVYLGVGLLLTVSLLISPLGVYSSFSKFNYDILRSNNSILVLSIPLFALILIANYLTDILTSHKYFTIPMVSSILNSFLSLLSIILFQARLGVLSILVGLIAAYVSQIILLLFLMVRALGWDFRPTFVRLTAVTKRNIALAQAGNITSSLVGYAPLYLLSAFDAGSITALNYGQRISDLPTTLIIAQVSVVVGIKFNELYAKRSYDQLDRVFCDAAKNLLFVLIPISTFIFLFDREITAVLFKRGSFDLRAVNTTADFVRLFSLLLPMVAVSNLVSRLFMASQKLREALVYQIAFNIALLVLIYAGVRMFGVLGYPIALVTMHCINILVCHLLTRLFFKMIDYRAVLLVFAQLLAINCAIALPIQYMRQYSSSLSPVASLSLWMSVYASILFGLSTIFRLSVDGLSVFQSLKNRFKT